MKFEPGQVVIHAPTKSRWIIMGLSPYDEFNEEHEHFKRPYNPSPQEKYQVVVSAYCLYSGSKPDYWQPNQLDAWVMTNRDCENNDLIWEVISD
jgi:hypothetical protein